ncbi:MAG TPA: class I SAM-dependent methyltransferase [Candidatus Saccharimonadales bacterium]|nr:class I SAM-dependent methyltransferase [Candidatus Saccharimonadales bacterium]
MNHLDFYKFQAKARGVHSLEDVQRIANTKSFIYDRIVSPWLPQDATIPIAEAACGHGSFLYWLKTRGYTNIRGVDSSSEQIEFARQIGVTVEQDDVNRWLARQPKNQFAAIIAIDLVEHFPKDDFMELLHLAHITLSVGGKLILRLPNGDSPLVGMNLFNDITHVWTYTPNALNSLSQMHGFSTAQFADEGADAIRDHRWLKVPLAKISRFLLRATIRSVTREDIRFWSPHLWACLKK